MFKLGLALFASLLALGTAAAADLPAKMYTKAPAMAAPPPFSWTGFYVGGNVGYSWGRQDITVGGVSAGTVKVNGVIGGGQLGYNWQVNQIVLGLEADIQASGQKGDGTISPFAALNVTTTYRDKLDWFGTLRGRLGYAADHWLPYVTAGWAFGHGNISGSSTAPVSFSGSKNYSGWTVGGGLEWAFRNNWSAKLEYLYIDFGDGPTTPVIATGRLTDNILRVGVNYHF
jgi:outer membrane immunogenic protein